MSQLPDFFHLAADDVHVWCVGLDVPSEASARLYATLSREERNRSSRFRFERDRRRFIVAHGALHDLIGRYLETAPDRLRFVHNAFGKPDLAPEFGAKLKFNLSHSSGLAFIAFTAAADIGVDVEHIRAQPDFADIARRFFAAAEADHLIALPSHLRTEAFFGCWTKKEAYLKASGEGFAKPLTGFSVRPTAESAETPVDHYLASDAVGRAKRWSLYTLEPAPGYIGAVAIEGTGARLSQRVWSMPYAPVDSASGRTGPRHGGEMTQQEPSRKRAPEAAFPGELDTAAAQDSGHGDVTEPGLRECPEVGLDV